ncbi:MAG: DOMON-like domain-containing protein [Rhodocyclaceae bacterium]|nr:DOMON-like domain-containing protein [Rhodocyclaceae bacterium]
MRALCEPANLLPHPDSAEAGVLSLRVEICRDAGGALVLDYRLRADMARIRLPAPGPGGAADELWRHTCFEGFLAPAGAPDYREFNFSPCSAWAVYDFSAYRARGADSPAAAPVQHWDTGPGGLRLVARLQPALLPRAGADGQWQLALAAVIENRDGGIAWWALRHAAGRPDFHLRANFALALPAFATPAGPPP